MTEQEMLDLIAYFDRHEEYLLYRISVIRERREQYRQSLPDHDVPDSP